MKRFVLLALSAMTVALCQPLAVFAADGFRVTPDGQKVFSYGFPFVIVDCAEHLPLHMSPWQIPLRLAGNFGAFFLGGWVVVRTLGRLHRPLAPQKSA